MKINKDKLFYIGLLVCCALVLLIFYFANQDGNSCIGNPLTYGAEKLSTIETGEMACTCFFKNPNYAPFYFNQYNVSTELLP